MRSPDTPTIITRNNVKIMGNGSTPMMLAHGFGCDQSVWRFMIPHLKEHYKLILFDYVGSGSSDTNAYNPERYDSLHGYAQDIIDICNALELRDVIFVGHSVSSAIGVLAANQHPEFFKQLVFVCPSPRYLNDLPAYYGGFSAEDLHGLLELMERNPLGWGSFLAPLVSGSDASDVLTEELESRFCSLDQEIARVFARATFLSDHREDFLRLRVPSLVLQSRDDAIAPLVVGEYLAACVPECALRVLDTVGHSPHMSLPVETTRLIRAYLQSGS